MEAHERSETGFGLRDLQEAVLRSYGRILAAAERAYDESMRPETLRDLIASEFPYACKSQA